MSACLAACQDRLSQAVSCPTAGGATAQLRASRNDTRATLVTGSGTCSTRRRAGAQLRAMAQDRLSRACPWRLTAQPSRSQAARTCHISKAEAPSQQHSSPSVFTDKLGKQWQVLHAATPLPASHTVDGNVMLLDTLPAANALHGSGDVIALSRCVLAPSCPVHCPFASARQQHASIARHALESAM